VERPDAAGSPLTGMTSKPVVVNEDERDWEGWREDEVAERGNVRWRLPRWFDRGQSVPV
jgi:hypothetical protein